MPCECVEHQPTDGVEPPVFYLVVRDGVEVVVMAMVRPVSPSCLLGSLHLGVCGSNGDQRKRGETDEKCDDVWRQVLRDFSSSEKQLSPTVQQKINYESILRQSKTTKNREWTTDHQFISYLLPFVAIDYGRDEKQTCTSRCADCTKGTRKE